MSIDLATIRKSKDTDYKAIIEQLQQKPQTQYQKDERFWQLDKDKMGNGSAVIRFLPSIVNNEYAAPYVEIIEYNFMGPSKRYYNNKSLRTIKKPDPVKELNDSLWATGIQANIDFAKSLKVQTRYITNILVISDPKNPENEGKVFLFKCPKAVYNKIMAKLTPAFEDETPVNIFDLYNGANFRFRMKRKDKYANYDDSTFADRSPVGTEEDMMRIMNSTYNIQEFLDPSTFKSYDELKKELDFVLDSSAPASKTAEEIMEDVPSFPSPSFKSVSAPEPAKVTAIDDDDDDMMDYFNSLAND